MSAQKAEPWSPEKFERWYREHPVIPSRDYAKTLVPRIQTLGEREGFAVETYGEATYTTNNEAGDIDEATHDLFRVLVGDFDPEKPTYIVIGGTHGYEKSGPLAALEFAEEEAARYADEYNIVVYPCLCPGPYEKELRFTQGRIDPNRDALPEGAKSQEMQAFAASITELHTRIFEGDLTRKFAAAIDLHETPKMDIEINAESAEAVGQEVFNLDVFPRGMVLIAFGENQGLGRRILCSVSNSDCRLVDDEETYGAPNRGGMVLIEDITIEGTVAQLMKELTTASFITEYCDPELTDDTPDVERVGPQRAAIRGMLPALEANRA